MPSSTGQVVEDLHQAEADRLVPRITLTIVLFRDSFFVIGVDLLLLLIIIIDGDLLLPVLRAVEEDGSIIRDAVVVLRLVAAAAAAEEVLAVLLRASLSFDLEKKKKPGLRNDDESVKRDLRNLIKDRRDWRLP